MRPATYRLTAAALMSTSVCMLAGCASSPVDFGGAPPAGSARHLLPAILMDIANGDESALARTLKGSDPAEIKKVVQGCGRISRDSETTSLESPDGPQQVTVTVNGRDAEDRSMAANCKFYLYWNQDTRSWTMGSASTA